MANHAIIHEGVVREVYPDQGKVLVHVGGRSDSCGSCAAAMLCGASNDRPVMARMEQGQTPFVGSTIRVGASPALHLRSVILMLVLPWLMLIAGSIPVFLLGGGPLWAAVSGVSMMGLTYLVLWIMRKRLHTELFTVID